MNKTTLTSVAAATTVLAIGGAFYANAGNLNPPAGPVSSTMVTLDDIHDALQGEAEPVGNNTYYMQVAGIAGETSMIPGVPPGSIAVHEYELSSFAEIVGGGAGVAQMQLSPIAVTIPQDTTTPLFYARIASGAQISDVVIQQYRDIGGPAPVLLQEWALKDVNVVAFNPSARGTTAGSVALEFWPVSLCIKSRMVNINGSLGPFESFCWNFQTSSTCSCP